VNKESRQSSHLRTVSISVISLAVSPPWRQRVKQTTKWTAVGALGTVLAAIVAAFQLLGKSPDVAISGGSNNVGIGSVSGNGQVTIGGSELKGREAEVLSGKAKLQFDTFMASAKENGEVYCKQSLAQALKLGADAQAAMKEGRHNAAAELFSSAAEDAQKISSTIGIYQSLKERVGKEIERARSEVAGGTRKGRDATFRARLESAEKLAANGDLMEASETIDPVSAKHSKRTLDQMTHMNSGCVSFKEYVAISDAK